MYVLLPIKKRCLSNPTLGTNLGQQIVAVRTGCMMLLFQTSGFVSLSPSSGTGLLVQKYIYIYIYIYTCVLYIYIYIYIYLCVLIYHSLSLYIYIYIYTYVEISIFRFVSSSRSTYVCGYYDVYYTITFLLATYIMTHHDY